MSSRYVFPSLAVLCAWLGLMDCVKAGGHVNLVKKNKLGFFSSKFCGTRIIAPSRLHPTHWSFLSL